MPRVKVIADDGWVALDEGTCGVQLESDHYRRYLAERIAWAVEDSEARMESGPASRADASDRPLRLAA